MERKDYNLEIIQELLMGENHPRAIAKKLEINHMTIVRKLKCLLDDNIVDFKKVGKNKTYFLKKTIEARSYLYESEHYKLVRILRKYPELRKIIEKIHRNNKIKLTILFGSYAKELAGKNSDIDIYIETKDKNLKKALEQLNSKLSIKIGDFNLESLLAKEIIKSHVIIKGVEEYYERVRFFE
tara:strand:+ start:413 stop:961 length:549 start_codon:yes stop_codon:yes gene_type:complete